MTHDKIDARMDILVMEFDDGGLEIGMDKSKVRIGFPNKLFFHTNIS